MTDSIVNQLIAILTAPQGWWIPVLLAAAVGLAIVGVVLLAIDRSRSSVARRIFEPPAARRDVPFMLGPHAIHVPTVKRFDQANFSASRGTVTPIHEVRRGWTFDGDGGRAA